MAQEKQIEQLETIIRSPQKGSVQSIHKDAEQQNDFPEQYDFTHQQEDHFNEEQNEEDQDEVHVIRYPQTRKSKQHKLQKHFGEAGGQDEITWRSIPAFSTPSLTRPSTSRLSRSLKYTGATRSSKGKMSKKRLSKKASS